MATASAFGLPRRERTYTTLLMATGLTFGSIAALFGYTHHFVPRTQYTELVTVAVLSAFVPTIIAQQFFRPKVVDIDVEEALGAEDISLVHRRPADARRKSDPAAETSTVVASSTSTEPVDPPP